MSLTESQVVGFEALKRWVDSDEPYFILGGSAGVGKTYLTKEFVELFGNRLALTATTHKACGVLAEATGNHLTTKTIHSTLGLKLTRDGFDYVLKQNLDKLIDNLSGVDIVVVDEGYTLGKEVISFIEEDVRINKRKYLFIGDICQVLPVNEKESLINNFCEPHILTEIVRQAKNSPIINIATQLRDRILNSSREKIVLENIETPLGSIYVLNDDQFDDAVYDNDFNDGQDKIISWTNSKVNVYNAFVNHRYGIVDTPFVEGSRVLFNEAVFVGDDMIVQNSHETVVKSIELTTHVKSNLPVYRVKVEEPSQDTFYVKPLECLDKYEEYFDGLIKAAKENRSLYKVFFDEKESFADIRPVYSSTVHKAQGSTYRDVYIDLPDIMKNYNVDEKWRLLYTAITRSSRNVFFKAGKDNTGLMAI